MRILFFTNTHSLYIPVGIAERNTYNGGGWITSVEAAMRRQFDVELGVSFIMNGQPERVVQDGVTYYPISSFVKGRFKRLWNKLGLRNSIRREKASWLLWEKKILKVVHDFQPDIIQVFGSEGPFGLIGNKVEVPVILHIQGLIIPYKNAFLPPAVSWRTIKWQSFHPKKWLLNNLLLRSWQLQAMREQEILYRIDCYLGRTTWDERVVKVYNPKAEYRFGGEILRSEFYEDGERALPKKLTIVSTISSPLYKGYDLALKTAKLLTKEMHLDFEWKMYGNIDPVITEKMVGIRHQDVGIKLMGVATAKELRESLLRATVYVHTSYIDNSPNSVCEAQMMGVPVVCTAVGGVPSLIEEGKTGFLVPANDPYQLAYLVRYLSENQILNKSIGENAKAMALERHNPEHIIQSLLDYYKTLICYSIH